MKYIAHLSTGGTVELFSEEALDPVKIEEIDWLLDDRGTLVRWSAVIALVSIIEPDSDYVPSDAMAAAFREKYPHAGQQEAPGEVVALIDREGDRWPRRGEDDYRFVYGDGTESSMSWTRAQIEEVYGPVKEVRGLEG